VFTIQRVRVRWTAAERGAPHADAVVAWIARLRYRFGCPRLM
jgi:hypothetical protein